MLVSVRGGKWDTPADVLRTTQAEGSFKWLAGTSGRNTDGLPELVFVTPAAAPRPRNAEEMGSTQGPERVCTGVGGGVRHRHHHVLTRERATRTEAPKPLQPQAWAPDQGLDGRHPHGQRIRTSR